MCFQVFLYYDTEVYYSSFVEQTKLLQLFWQQTYHAYPLYQTLCGAGIIEGPYSIIESTHYHDTTFSMLICSGSISIKLIGEGGGQIELKKMRAKLAKIEFLPFLR